MKEEQILCPSQELQPHHAQLETDDCLDHLSNYTSLPRAPHLGHPRLENPIQRLFLFIKGLARPSSRAGSCNSFSLGKASTFPGLGLALDGFIC